MKAIKYVLAVAIACASAFAFAQAPAVPTTASAVVTSEQKAAVKELLEAMNFKKMMSQTVAAMTQSFPQIMEQMTAGDMSLTAEQKVEARKLSAKSGETMVKSMTDIYSDPQIVQGMEEIMARAYASNFAVDEIKAITAFYVSPAGKKMLAAQPQLLQQTMPEIMTLVTPRVKELMSRMAREIAEQAKAQSNTGAAPAKK